MAIAGRVAIVPKGEWSQSVTYDKLDLVTYNGNTFIAYKSSVGVVPTDGDTWMLVLEGIDPQDIENIIDGTTPVGDTLKLGGKGASEWQEQINDIQTRSSGTLNTGWYRIAEYTGATSTQLRGTYANSCKIFLQNYGAIYNSHCELVLNSITDKKEFCLIDSFAHVQKYTKIRYVTDANSTKGYIEIYCNADSIDTAITLEAPTIKGNHPYWQAITPTLTSETVSGVTVETTYDIQANTKPATTADLANYLPLSGGKVTGITTFETKGGVPVNISRTDADLALASYHGISGLLGHLGFDAVNSPILRQTDGYNKKLLHTGNKPTGTYTGTGASNTISVGGIGKAVLVKNTTNNDIAFVTNGGYIGKQGTNVVCGVNGSLSESTMTMNLADNNTLFNANGVQYTYQVL